MIIQHKEYKCKVHFQKYQNNNNTAILLYGAPETDYEHELITIATVNGDITLPKNIVGIKTWSENEGIVQSLVDGNVIKPFLLGGEPTGYVVIEHYKLTEEALKQMDKQQKENS